MAKRQKKKATRKKTPADPFSQLTWENLEEWAGNRIVTRGRSYHRRGAVQNLARTADGALLAWVQGSWRYATRVSIQDRKQLESECTCPYWDTCKHAVAVVLKYLECLKEKVSVEEADEDDPRLEELKRVEEDLEELEEFEEFEIEEYEEEFDESDFPEEEDTEVRVAPKRPRKKATSLRSFLEEQTQAELVSLLEEIAAQFPEVHELLQDRRTLASGQSHQILQTVRREISALRQPEWDDYGYGAASGNIDRLEAALRALVESDQADAVVRLGPELLATGNRTIEYEHEGESSPQLSACLDIAFGALSSSSLSAVDQVEWAIDMALSDEYDLCDDGLARFWKKRYGKSDWSEVADRLQQRLDASEEPSGEDDFSNRFGRDRLSNWLIAALQRGGRKDEIIPLCEREAPVTDSYARLVDLLIENRRWDDARSWCLRGIEACPSPYPGISASLRQRLRTIDEKTGNRLGSLALQAEEFFAAPSAHGFQELCKAARKARVGKAVEVWARYYLESGRRPSPSGPGSRKKRKGDPAVNWPLPAPAVQVERTRSAPEAPVIEVLIQIAIAEKKPDEVLKWYDRKSKKKRPYGFYASFDLQVAEAVKSKYPDRAVEIWKETAERHIATVQVSGYEAASPYLRQVKNTLTRAGRKAEWEDYLESLREQNGRRPRCLEMLERLTGARKKIIDT